MPTINRNTIPKIGAGLINTNSSKNQNEPKINKPMINPVIKSTIARKDSDHQMTEPQVTQQNNVIKTEKDEKTTITTS